MRKNSILEIEREAADWAWCLNLLTGGYELLHFRDMTPQVVIENPDWHTRETLVVSQDFVEIRYPRLIRLIQYVYCPISRENAIQLIRAYLAGHPTCQCISEWAGLTAASAMKEVLIYRAEFRQHASTMKEYLSPLPEEASLLLLE